jgi:RNA polymerase sigma-70 factor (ECF subfamily)
MEDELIRQSQSGDPAAFAELVGPLQGPLYNLAHRFTADAEEAKDIVQDALTRAWINIPRLSQAESFKPWMFRITVNLCRNSVRGRDRRPATTPLDQLVVIDGAGGDAEAIAVGREGHARILAAIAALAPDYRAAVVLRDVNDLSYQEIAAVTHVSIGTVRSRISRGRAELRRRLQEPEEEQSLVVGQ